jgi:hypothetical protein
MTFTVRLGQVINGKSKQSTVVKNGKDLIDVDVELVPSIGHPPTLVLRVAISTIVSGTGSGNVWEEDRGNARTLFGVARATYDAATLRDPQRYPAITPAEWGAIDAELVKAGSFNV